jgi:hypothetical protein
MVNALNKQGNKQEEYNIKLGLLPMNAWKMNQVSSWQREGKNMKIIEKVASFHLISSLGTMGLDQFVASKYAIMKMLKRTLVVLLVNCLPSFFF